MSEVRARSLYWIHWRGYNAIVCGAVSRVVFQCRESALTYEIRFLEVALEMAGSVRGLVQGFGDLLF